MKSYCIVCKNDTENKNPEIFRTRNKRLTIISTCAVCNKNQDFSVKMKDLVYYQVLGLELL